MKIKDKISRYCAILVAMLMVMSSCHDDYMLKADFQAEDIPEGYQKITFKAGVPNMRVVESRSIDPDGEDISNMTLFCFNSYGLFITTVDAELTDQIYEAGHTTSGKFTAIIPNETHIIHFVANHPKEMYILDDLNDKTEDQIIASMEGASGICIDWARFEYNPNLTDANGNPVTSINDQLSTVFNPVIRLIRNQAKITVTDVDNRDGDGNEWTHDDFIVTGYATANIHAFGTVAPYHPVNRFPTQMAAGDNSWWPGEDYVTLPANQAMMSDLTEVNTKHEDYIFEHENTIDNPVSVIIRGKYGETGEELYYRAMLIDADGELLKVRRNHWYKLHITGQLTYGSKTFEEAMEGPATNNVWASVEAWINEISDGVNILSVEETGVVIGQENEGQAYELKYKLTDTDGRPLSQGAEISWLDGNNVAYQNMTNQYNTATGVGTITIQLYRMAEGNQYQSGTILVKKGHLQRTIEVVMLKTQKLTPVWVGTQVYGGTTGNHVTLRFTIPDDTPDIMYPFNVLVTVASLDIRNSSGQELPVVIKGDDEYFGNDYEGIGYKYVYEVTKPGTHRLYFSNTLTEPGGYTQPLHLEAKYFETVDKIFTYANHQRSITLDGLTAYSENAYADDEPIYFRLVPQKINAPVIFAMQMKDMSNNTNINAGPDDEFLLYSQTVDWYRDEELDDELKAILGIENFDCRFYDIDENYWETSTNGRVMAFKPRNPDKTGNEVGHYSIYLRTTRAVSEDIVRLASNVAGQKSAVNTAEDYTGNSYRSIIFELANYRPFRFAAQVNGIGNYGSGMVDEEPETDLELTYEPNQDVDISFDVTSFAGYDGNSADPFGTEFEIYIDAPMLEIDQVRLAQYNLNSDKLKADPKVKGRFIYTVDANRDVERTYGTNVPVLIADGTAGVNQTGERKVLPFRTSRITSTGEIRISSNKSKVVYYDQLFSITNRPITGRIYYTNDENATTGLMPVPKDAFVAFALKKNGVRIGAITMTADGVFSLNLRAEYDFNWDDPVEMDYIVRGANNTNIVYDSDIASGQQQITLRKLFEGTAGVGPDNAIVLTLPLTE